MSEPELSYSQTQENRSKSLALAGSATYGKEQGSVDLTLRQGEYLSKTPSLSEGVIKRAFTATASPRQAIKAKCLACTNWQRHEVAFCATETCSLWRYRPYQYKATEAK